MKHSNQSEEIFFSKYSFEDLRQKQLLRWLVTVAESLRGCQQNSVKKVYLRTLDETHIINMS